MSERSIYLNSIVIGRSAFQQVSNLTNQPSNIANMVDKGGFYSTNSMCNKPTSGTSYHFFLAKRISVLHFTSKARSSPSLRSFSLHLSYLFFIRVNFLPQTKRTPSADIVYAFPQFQRLLLCFPGTGCGHECQVRAQCVGYRSGYVSV